jgi:coenzyme F420-dependent glucose-6-phosphate dehydrogenase
MLRLGYKSSAEQFGPRELIEFSKFAEDVGFDSVFVSDHFQPWRHTGGHAPFSLAWLGALAASTSRIIVGTSVLTPTFRYHPSIVAQAFGTLGSLFPGRVILGLGSGESLNETPSSGMKWPEPKERTGRFREAIELIQRLWSEERVSFRGQYYQTENATIYDRPEQPVPIYIAAAGPVVAKLAGEKAEGFICTSGKDMKLYSETLLPNVSMGLQKSGRAPDVVDRLIEMKVSFDTDFRRALEDTSFWGALALSPEEKMNTEDPLEMERLADALPLERTAKRWIVSSDPEEHVEAIRPYLSLGFNHLVFHAPGPDQARFIRLYSDHVLPLLRREFGCVLTPDLVPRVSGATKHVSGATKNDAPRPLMLEDKIDA